MSLEIKAKQILDNFESSSSNDIVEVLNQIQGTFQSKITQDYLQGKLKKILDASEEDQKKKLCKNLKPYLDWYLQGL
jgi:hypothetical protein